LNLAGTSTGRLSSSNPNLQNVPDASHTGVEIRGGFIPTPGNVFIEADHKQLEVRVAAWLSGDEVMRGIFESGRDPHQEIAYSIYGLPKEQITHYMRWLAKNILFGLLYGRGYESVATGPEQEDIAARGGRRWGLDEVKSFYDNLLAEWAQFAEWQQNQKVMGYRDGEIVMPTGRRRRFGFIPRHDAGYVGRASFNNPIQGTASDFTLYALIRLHARLPEGAHLVLTVHDSLLIDCPRHLVDEVCDLIHEVMEDDTLFDIDVPLLADIDIEERWGEKEGAKQHIPIVEQEAIERAENESKVRTLKTAEPYSS
jgi:DNA polymerase-1